MPEISTDPMKYFEERIKDSLRSILPEYNFDQKIILEHPPSGFGDFAFPCFAVAKAQKKNPVEVAKSILSKLQNLSEIEIETKGPYLNFKISDRPLVERVLDSILYQDLKYGNHPKNEDEIILEHTSANPTDKLHVGRARNPIIGDTLARILRCAGYEVETQYYVDDMGKQTARKILELRYPDWDKIGSAKDTFKTGYQWATSVTTPSSAHYDEIKATELEKIMDGLEGGNVDTLKEAEKVCELMMNDVIIPSLERLGITIDRYVNESEFMLDNTVSEVIDKLKSSEHFNIEDGAYYIDLSQFNTKTGKEKFFFVRADGKSLYATRDIAYHHWKFDHCDTAINILGEDHKLETEYVRIGLQLTGGTKFPENIFYAFVNLPEGRMSTRKGQVVYMDDLVDEAIRLAVQEVKKRRDDLLEDEIVKIAEIVGIGAVRYNIIRVQAEKKIVFKWEDALNFEGDSAPFVQYAHARACSILRKASMEGLEYLKNKFVPIQLNNTYELELIRLLGKLPGLIKECALNRFGHPIAGYAQKVAAAFNQFYRECPVLQADASELVQSRLAIVDATRIVLRNTLSLLGISAPEKM